MLYNNSGIQHFFTFHFATCYFHFILSDLIYFTITKSLMNFKQTSIYQNIQVMKFTIVLLLLLIKL